MRYIQRFDSASTEQAAIDAGQLGKPYIAFIEDGQYIDWNTKDKRTKVVAYFTNKGAKVCFSCFYGNHCEYCDTFSSIELEDGTVLPKDGQLANYWGDSDVLKVYYILRDKNVLGDHAFGQAQATKVEIPDGVTLGTEVFTHCGAELSAVTLPSDLVVLPTKTLRSCGGLRNIVLPDTLQEIGEEALAYAGFTSLTFGPNISSIGRQVIWQSDNIEWIEFKGLVPPVFARYALTTNLNFPIYVPDSAVNAYKTAPNITEYADRIKGISEKPE